MVEAATASAVAEDADITIEAADDADEVEEAEEADEALEVEAAEVDNTEDDPDDPQVEFTLLDGQVIRTTKEELAQSYMRQRDYTQKSQENAEVRKNL